MYFLSDINKTSMVSKKTKYIKKRMTKKTQSKKQKKQNEGNNPKSNVSQINKKPKRNVRKIKKIPMSKVFPRAGIRKFAVEILKENNQPIYKISSKAITELGDLFVKDTLNNLTESYMARKPGIQWIKFDHNERSQIGKRAIRVMYTMNL